MDVSGSGKTAAFLIPIIQRLDTHSVRAGCRAVVLSPTRELAAQTLRFFLSLAHFTDLRSCLLVGGERFDDQFEALTRNPDVIIATPGRLMHLLREVPHMQLQAVQIVVFDEADRLFEMGFAEQLKQILDGIPETHQTLMLSATLPKALLQFSRAGYAFPRHLQRFGFQAYAQSQESRACTA